jgi:hypothetical protein
LREVSPQNCSSARATSHARHRHTGVGGSRVQAVLGAPGWALPTLSVPRWPGRTRQTLVRSRFLPSEAGAKGWAPPSPWGVGGCHGQLRAPRAEGGVGGWVGGGLLCLAAAHFPLAAAWFRLSFDNRWDVLRRAGLQGDLGLSCSTLPRLPRHKMHVAAAPATRRGPPGGWVGASAAAPG